MVGKHSFEMLDRMFAEKKDHEDGQDERRSELDLALKALLSVCDQARKTAWGSHLLVSIHAPARARTA